ncbi:major facilitator superfamily domain-containing protein 6 [Procambarus clarkii]|uniref:major facilitator superfamily domain-containing protein 6 n=1 Tax=Procambarus clarkii TaxID=6728 RepID=UPI001E677188|nr:major facilitator superfamily domain-containing protein 6-like [Procambarus clarkii]XP_045603622.1 major facilitator superfamily domain-containing protein 6-like [Procambarus clarkii]XP_045603623.1 major facilitator superfamily domain-containing protein 6-like [Procambarus clarkii]XP_045603624.1 major facilitator superfamily domain-containing protein 6-like [Procambarus clarkii]
MAFKINKKLLPMKIVYFFKYGGIAFFPFMPVVVRGKGISDAGIGLMWAVTPLASLMTSMLAGTLADAFKIHRAMFMTGMVLLTTSFITVFLLPAIPRPSDAPTEASVSFQCGDNSSSLDVCFNPSLPLNISALPSVRECSLENERSQHETENENTFNCSLQCSLLQTGSSFTTAEDEDLNVLPDLSFDFGNELSAYNVCVKDNCVYIEEEAPTLSLPGLYNMTCGQKYPASCHYQCTSGSPEITLGEMLNRKEFWFIFICLIFVYGGNSTTTTLSDTVCFMLLGKARHNYGRQRMWGSVSWGVVGLVSGALVNYYSRGQPQINYTPALIICSTLLFFNLIASSRIKFNLPQREKLKAKHFGVAICSVRMIVFLLTVVVNGVVSGVVMTFQFIVIEEVATAWDPNFPYMKLLQGIIHGVSTFLGEVPFMFLSSYIIKHLGNITTFAVSLASYSVQYFLFSCVINPWFFALTCLLHGLSFGLFYPNMSAYANLMSPKGAQAVMQGLVRSTYIGGACMGGLVGGLMLEAVGGSTAFRYTSLLAAGNTVFFVGAHLLIHKLCPQHTTEGERGEYSTPGDGKVGDNELDPVVLASITGDQMYSSNLQIA